MSVPFWTPLALAHVSESLGLFFGLFDEYAAPYLILKSALYPILVEEAGSVASRMLGGVFLAVVAVSLLSDDGTQRSWPRILAVGLLGFALAASTLHPWYWLPVLFVTTAMPHRPAVLWLIAWASAGYLGYAFPGGSLFATVVGWGGAGAIWVHFRHRRVTPRATRPPVPEPSRLLP